MVPSQKATSALRTNEHGVVAIEFAIVAPVLFLLLMGIIEFGLIIWASNVVEAAVNDAARQATSGNQHAPRSFARYGKVLPRDEYIREEIKRIAGSLIAPDEVDISCTNLGDSFGNVTQRQSGNFQCGGGALPSVSCNEDDMGTGKDKAAVLYTATVCWDLFTPMIGQFFPGGSYPIRSSMVVRNE